MADDGFILVNPDLWKNPKMEGLTPKDFVGLFDLSFYLAFPEIYEKLGLPKNFPISELLTRKIIKKRSGRFYLDGRIIKNSNGKCLFIPSIFLEGGDK